MLVGVGRWDHAGLSQIERWYSALLPWLAYLAILLFSDWIGGTIMGSWGLWAARRDLVRLMQDLAVLETWRLGGWYGARFFLFLFWTSLLALAVYGALFLCSGILAVVEAVPQISADFVLLPAKWGNVLNGFVGSLVLLWLGYGVFLRVWRLRYPLPPIPDDGVPKVPSLIHWQKRQLLQTYEEAIAFLSLFREACPEFSTPKGLPWKVLLFSLPEFSWHFYRWSGGQMDMPMAASASIGLLGAASVFLSLWWLVPWSFAQTKGILRPDRISPCSYLPVLQLRRLAQRLIS